MTINTFVSVHGLESLPAHVTVGNSDDARGSWVAIRIGKTSVTFFVTDHGKTRLGRLGRLEQFAADIAEAIVEEINR